jgi:hypothetical protein
MDSCTLPFHGITNCELYNTLNLTERHIKEQLTNDDLYRFVKASQPPSNLLEKSCRYYTTDEFRQNFQNQKGTKLLHLNIRSLDKHWTGLHGLVDALGNIPDYIALSEIGCKNIENRSAQLKQFGFEMIFEKPTTSKGGVALLTKNACQITERVDLKIIPEAKGKLVIENIWCETELDDSKKSKIVFGIIYKHPGGNMESLKEFRLKLEQNLIKLNQEGKLCIITGDLNIDGLKVRTNNEVQNFFNTMLTHDFIPTITIPTRIADYTTSLIDHIFINRKCLEKFTKINAGNIYSGISDHLPNFLVANSSYRSDSKSRPMVRIFGDKNTSQFNDLIKNCSWNDFDNTSDEDTAMNLFYKKYHDAFNKAFPLKKLSRNRAKDKKWMTYGLRKSIDNKNRLYKKSITKPSEENKAIYRKYKKTLVGCLRKAEELYYFNLLNTEKKNLNMMWDTIGKIVNPAKVKKKNTIPKLIVGNKCITEDHEIANAINEHFGTVGEELAKNFPNNDNYLRYLGPSNCHSFFLSPANTDEILGEINRLGERKASGHDNIKPKLLKAASTILAEKITHIINLSFKNGQVPTKLKIAKVIPIYKKNNRTDPNNYRPISLLSIINKIMEKIMYKRLKKFLDKFKILYKYQFGFRENHSTTMAIMEIVDNIISEIDNGKLVAGIYLDLSKAFDTVDHKILTKKLEHYGIRGTSLKWFQSYLSNRKQYTLVNDQKSNMLSVTFGVPQGSVLGPLLFLVYINDLANCMPSDNNTRLFADDTNVFISDKHPDQLKQKMVSSIKELHVWLACNKLTVNLAKTQYSIFKSTRSVIPDFLSNIKIDGNLIRRVPNAKFLGVTLDENLKWDAHIQLLQAYLTKITNAFKIIKNYVPKDKKMLLYYAYIYSRIQYGIEVYGKTASKHLQKIQINQNRALKVLFNKNYYTPTSELHKDLKIPKVADIAKIHVLKFVQKQRNGKVPDTFNNLFTVNAEVHNHNTRQALNLTIPQPRNELSKQKLNYNGPVLWNQLPAKIRNTKCPKTFSRLLRSFFIDKY